MIAAAAVAVAEATGQKPKKKVPDGLEVHCRLLEHCFISAELQDARGKYADGELTWATFYLLVNR